MDKTLQRLAALENQVGKLVFVVTRMLEGIEMAKQLPAQCSKCGEDFTQVEDCPEEDCPCGR